MTLTTKAEHEEAREKKESEAWRRCDNCDTYVHEQDKDREKYIGRWFCDRWCVEEFIEKLRHKEEAFDNIKEIAGLSKNAGVDETVEKIREICEELKMREEGFE